MKSECLDGWWCWLSWGGWAGVGGLFAVAAILLAAILGVLTLASTRPSPRMFNISPRGTRALGQGKSEMSLELSAVGPEALYELDVTHVKAGMPDRLIGATTPVLRVGDPPLMLSVTTEGAVADNWLILEWWEPTSKEPVFGGARFNLAFDRTYVWRRWRFPVWPLRFSGRWLRMKDASSRVDIDRRPPKH